MKQYDRMIDNLKGPIIIFGAGGFIGFNLLQTILRYRSDVFGVFSEPNKNWRLKKLPTPLQNVVKCDLTIGGGKKHHISEVF